MDDIHNSFTNLKNISKIEINNFGKLSIDENRTIHTSGRSSFGISED